MQDRCPLSLVGAPNSDSDSEEGVAWPITHYKMRQAECTRTREVDCRMRLKREQGRRERMRGRVWYD
jgi:hypothetical protein